MNFSKKSKIILSIVLLILIGGYSTLNYVYKPHKTLEDREVKFTGSIDAFAKKVSIDPSRWQDVVVELSGKVTSIDDNGFTMNDNAFFQLEDTSALVNVKKEKALTVKARMIGYDDLLEELKLDQAKISN